MNHKIVAWMECRAADVSFRVKFGSRKEANEYARERGFVVIETRRGN